MKRWKGIWIIAVSILHTIFAIVSYGAVYKKMINDGFIDSVNSVHSAVATWFLLFGILMFALGLMTYFYEKTGNQIPKSIAFTLLVLTILGAALMPVSGFWLLFPAVLAMFSLRKSIH